MELFSESTGLYLFSALLQANAAIIAIVGVFGIFKIQSLQSKIEFFKQGLNHPLGLHNTNKMLPHEIIKFDELNTKEKFEDLKSKKKGDCVIPLLSSWVNIEKTIENLKPIITKSTIWLGVGIIINALCLMFSYIIHQDLYVEFTIFLIVCIYQIILITILISNIKSMIDDGIKAINKDNKISNNQENKKGLDR